MFLHQLNNTAALSSRPRAIMHMDMDCFYAQVERERFPEWDGYPIAVVQNGNLFVAANYSVRMRGSAKLGYGSVLLQMIPQTKFAGGIMPRYRSTSRAWLEIVRSFPGIVVQKKSIDECYIDLTEAVKRRMLSLCIPHPYHGLVANHRKEKRETAQRLVESNEDLKRESIGSLYIAQVLSQSTDPLSRERGVGRPTENHHARPKGVLNADMMTTSSFTFEQMLAVGLKPKAAQKFLEASELERNLGARAFRKLENTLHPTHFCRAHDMDILPRLIFTPPEYENGNQQSCLNLVKTTYFCHHHNYGAEDGLANSVWQENINSDKEELLNQKRAFSEMASSSLSSPSLNNDVPIKRIRMNTDDLHASMSLPRRLAVLPSSSVWVGKVLMCEGDGVKDKHLESPLTHAEMPWLSITNGIEAGFMGEEASYQQNLKKLTDIANYTAADEEYQTKEKKVSEELDEAESSCRTQVRIIESWTSKSLRLQLLSDRADADICKMKARRECLKSFSTGCRRPSLSYLLSDKYCLRCFKSIDGMAGKGFSSFMDDADAVNTIMDVNNQKDSLLPFEPTSWCRPDVESKALKSTTSIHDSGKCSCEKPFIVPTTSSSSSSSSSSSTSPSTSTSIRDEAIRSHTMMLCIAAQIGYEIRTKIFQELGLTSSAAIAPNCMVAKLASQSHKPNQQSIVLPSIVHRFMSQHSLDDIPGFGPKSQAYAADFGFTQVSQIQKLSLQTLIAVFQRVPPTDEELLYLNSKRIELGSNMLSVEDKMENKGLVSKTSKIKSKGKGKEKDKGKNAQEMRHRHRSHNTRSSDQDGYTDEVEEEVEEDVFDNTDNDEEEEDEEEEGEPEEDEEEDDGEDEEDLDEEDKETNIGEVLSRLRRQWLADAIKQIEQSQNDAGGKTDPPASEVNALIPSNKGNGTAGVENKNKEGAIEIAFWLHRIGQGVDETPVEEAIAPKSIAQSKNQPVHNLEDKERLLKWLVDNLAQRIELDREEYSRAPTCLVFSATRMISSRESRKLGQPRSFSRRIPLPLPSRVVAAQYGTLDNPVYKETITTLARSLLSTNVKPNESLGSMSLSIVSFVPYSIVQTHRHMIPIKPGIEVSPQKQDDMVRHTAIDKSKAVESISDANSMNESHPRAQGSLYRRAAANQNRNANSTKLTSSYQMQTDTKQQQQRQQQQKQVTASPSKLPILQSDTWPACQILPPVALQTSFHKLDFTEALQIRRMLESMCPQTVPENDKTTIIDVANTMQRVRMDQKGQAMDKVYQNIMIAKDDLDKTTRSAGLSMVLPSSPSTQTLSLVHPNAQPQIQEIPKAPLQQQQQPQPQPPNQPAKSRYQFNFR